MIKFLVMVLSLTTCAAGPEPKLRMGDKVIVRFSGENRFYERVCPTEGTVEAFRPSPNRYMVRLVCGSAWEIGTYLWFDEADIGNKEPCRD